MLTESYNTSVRWPKIPEHVDAKNTTPSYSMSLGKYQGGKLKYCDGDQEIIDNHGKFVKMDGHRPHEVTQIFKNKDGTEAERFGRLWYHLPLYAGYLQRKTTPPWPSISRTEAHVGSWR